MMIGAIIALIPAFIVVGIAKLGTTTALKIATVLTWILFVFYGLSLLIDITSNIPRTMSSYSEVGDELKSALSEFKSRYIKSIRLSIIGRIAAIVLLYLWVLKA